MSKIKMMDKETHAKLEKEWFKVGRGVYQYWSRIKRRMPYFLQFADIFEGKDVLELGCNAGMYGHALAQIAKSYIGVDKGDYYVDQAKLTQKLIENPNVLFYKGNIKDFIKQDLKGEMPTYNALFSSFALYHFSEKETDRILETVLPKCDVVVIQTRIQKRSPWKKYNPWQFNKPKQVKKYLSLAGFECEIHYPENKIMAEIIGRRKDVDKGNDKGDTEKPIKASSGRGTQGVNEGRNDEGMPKRNAKRNPPDAKGGSGVLPQIQGE